MLKLNIKAKIQDLLFFFYPCHFIKLNEYTLCYKVRSLKSKSPHRPAMVGQWIAVVNDVMQIEDLTHTQHNRIDKFCFPPGITGKSLCTPRTIKRYSLPLKVLKGPPQVLWIKQRQQDQLSPLPFHASSPLLSPPSPPLTPPYLQILHPFSPSTWIPYTPGLGPQCTIQL